MEKEFTTYKLRQAAIQLISVWDENKKEIKLTGKSLYNLIALKKAIEAQNQILEETMVNLVQRYEGETTPQGGVSFPADKNAEAQKAFSDFFAETITLAYQEVIMSDTDLVPIAILEPLFDFITIQG